VWRFWRRKSHNGASCVRDGGRPAAEARSGRKGGREERVFSIVAFFREGVGWGGGWGGAAAAATLGWGARAADQCAAVKCPPRWTRMLERRGGRGGARVAPGGGQKTDRQNNPGLFTKGDAPPAAAKMGSGAFCRRARRRPRRLQTSHARPRFRPKKMLCDVLVPVRPGRVGDSRRRAAEVRPKMWCCWFVASPSARPGHRATHCLMLMGPPPSPSPPTHTSIRTRDAKTLLLNSPSVAFTALNYRLALLLFICSYTSRLRAPTGG
jgi:hypothetical protein